MTSRPGAAAPGRSLPLRTVAWIGTATAVLLALCVPGMLLVAEIEYLAGSLQAEADVTADLASALVVAHPQTWHFQEHRLEEILTRRARRGGPAVRWEVVAGERRVAAHGEPPAFPRLAREATIHDSGVPVGRVVISGSLVRAAAPVGLAVGAGGLLGALVLGVVYLVPGRTIRRRDEAVEAARAELTRQIAALEREVGERRRAEAELRDNEQRLELALSGSQAGLWELDLRTGALVLDRRATEIVGYRPGELDGRREAWEALVHPDDLAEARRRLDDHVHGDRPFYECEQRVRTPVGEWRWILSRGRVVEREADGQPLRAAGTHVDVTERKVEALRLDELNRELIAVSRRAGMAEVASGILHNAGNVLNSVNVSSTLVLQRLRASKVAGVRRVSALVEEHAGDLGAFLADDPRGALVPAYLRQLGEALAGEHQEILGEMERIVAGLEHVKQIVNLQQSYATTSGLSETVHLASIVEDALALCAAAYERHGVPLLRDFHAVSPVIVDRHRVLQILMNLLGNARHAVAEAHREAPQVTVRIAPDGADHVSVSVVDNGVGIAPGHLSRIFAHGFTTRRDGHGFGLHSSALAARQIGGALTAHSAGPGCGATFTLRLPVTATRP